MTQNKHINLFCIRMKSKKQMNFDIVNIYLLLRDRHKCRKNDLMTIKVKINGAIKL